MLSQINSADVIVIGVGAMGASTCWHLAQRGVRVLGIEQNGVPNSLGSSHGYTRMTRSAYCEHPDYVPLVRRANILWRELEAQSGQSILHLTGALYMGAPDSPLIQGSKTAADQHSIAYELLDGDSLASRFPQFQLPDGYVGLVEQEAGYLRPELAVAALANEALKRGAIIHGCERVLSWSETATGVTVDTDRTSYSAAHLIVAGGAWSGKLAHSLGVKLNVTRQVLGWVWPRKPDNFQPGTVPVWAVGHPDGSMHYSFPMLPDNPGLKVALHKPGDSADPDTLQRTPAPGDEETFLLFLREHVPSGSGPVLAMRICMYVNSPDGHFIVDRVPSTRHVTIACGFSGHGFKFAPVIGEALADLATEARTPLPIGFLRLGRFS